MCGFGRGTGRDKTIGRALGAPADHNPIESTFATFRHRTKVTKGPGSKTAGIAMAFKLIVAAQPNTTGVPLTHPTRSPPCPCTYAIRAAGGDAAWSAEVIMSDRQHGRDRDREREEPGQRVAPPGGIRGSFTWREGLSVRKPGQVGP